MAKVFDSNNDGAIKTISCGDFVLTESGWAIVGYGKNEEKCVFYFEDGGWDYLKVIRVLSFVKNSDMTIRLEF